MFLIFPLSNPQQEQCLHWNDIDKLLLKIRIKIFWVFSPFLALVTNVQKCIKNVCSVYVNLSSPDDHLFKGASRSKCFGRYVDTAFGCGSALCHTSFPSWLCALVNVPSWLQYCVGKWLPEIPDLLLFSHVSGQLASGLQTSASKYVTRCLHTQLPIVSSSPSAPEAVFFSGMTIISH